MTRALALACDEPSAGPNHRDDYRYATRAARLRQLVGWAAAEQGVLPEAVTALAAEANPARDAVLYVASTARLYEHARLGELMGGISASGVRTARRRAIARRAADPDFADLLDTLAERWRDLYDPWPADWPQQ